jgi:hypothetical protein
MGEVKETRSEDLHTVPVPAGFGNVDYVDAEEVAETKATSTDESQTQNVDQNDQGDHFKPGNRPDVDLAEIASYATSAAVSSALMRKAVQYVTNDLIPDGGDASGSACEDQVVQGQVTWADSPNSIRLSANVAESIRANACREDAVYEADITAGKNKVSIEKENGEYVVQVSKKNESGEDEVVVEMSAKSPVNKKSEASAGNAQHAEIKIGDSIHLEANVLEEGALTYVNHISTVKSFEAQVSGRTSIAILARNSARTKMMSEDMLAMDTHGMSASLEAGVSVYHNFDRASLSVTATAGPDMIITEGGKIFAAPTALFNVSLTGNE